MYQLCPGGAFLGTCEPTSFPQLRRAQEPALREAVCVLVRPKPRDGNPAVSLNRRTPIET